MLRYEDIPAPAAAVTLTMSDGAEILLRRNGNPDGPRVALSHGNGLSADVFFPFWRLLLARYDLVLFDMRNHGRNPCHGAAGHNYARFAADMEEIFHGMARAFGDKPVIGAFHSLSAIASLLHLRAHQPRWARLVLFDPPIFPRDGHPLQSDQLVHMTAMAKRAAKRQQRFASPDRLARQFASGAPFRRWVEGAPALVARATLRPDEAAGDWVLCCPRELESIAFDTNRDPTVWPSLAAIETPIKLVGGDPALRGQLTPALTCAAIAAEMALDHEAVPGTTHFLQIEAPEACVQAFERFVE